MKLIANSKNENIEIWKQLYFFKYIRYDVLYKNFTFCKKTIFWKFYF